MSKLEQSATKVPTKKADRPKYNEWMSKKSYYGKMVRKYDELSNQADQVKAALAKAKADTYRTKISDAEVKIEEARAEYGIGKRGGSKKRSTSSESDSSKKEAESSIDGLI